MMPDQPSGTLTFVFTDIEGSTRLWEQFPQPMHQARLRQIQLIASFVQAHHGTLLREHGEGDSTFSVFPHAHDALQATLAFQIALWQEAWPPDTPLRVRCALHTGVAFQEQGDYN